MCFYGIIIITGLLTHSIFRETYSHHGAVIIIIIIIIITIVIIIITITANISLILLFINLQKNVFYYDQHLTSLW